MVSTKTRLDIFLWEKGLCETRTQARALIMTGQVFVNGQREDKPGFFITKPDVNIEVKAQKCPYVSRGGLKLEKAIKEFHLDLSGKNCIDIGASTGGFTDCMLQYGAKKVFAVDVGYGQLDYRLRKDDRVAVFERTNFRYINKKLLGVADEIGPEFGCADVSFISLKHIFPAAATVMTENAVLTVLIKPQFEAGKGQVPKSGVVTDKEIHKKVINNVINFAAQSKFVLTGLTYSPIKGGKGNIEYLALFYRKENGVWGTDIDESFIYNLIERARISLD